ncbi:hypothetical protein U9M48_018327, partial [Paspalum notatum var. saurae]
HEVPIVVKQSIASRTNLFAAVLKKIILCTNVTKDLFMFMPYLLSFLLFRHDIPVVVKQSIAIASGTNLFAAILKNMTLGRNVTEDLLMLMPYLLSFNRHDGPMFLDMMIPRLHDGPAVVKQSIASGAKLFAGILEKMTLDTNVM